jgi:hypothetical protein
VQREANASSTGIDDNKEQQTDRITVTGSPPEASKVEPPHYDPHELSLASREAIQNAQALSELGKFADARRFSLEDPKLTVLYKPSQGWFKGGHLKDLGHAILETPDQYLDFGDDGGYKDPPAHRIHPMFDRTSMDLRVKQFQ